MIDPLFQDIAAQFPFEPTAEQSVAMNRLALFVNNPAPRQVFLMKGYAGTGKTTLITPVLDLANRAGKICQLMAPTGRAAKILAEKTNHPATTIHKAIYELSHI